MNIYHTSTYGYDWYIDKDGDISVEDGGIQGDIHLSPRDIEEMSIALKESDSDYL